LFLIRKYKGKGGREPDRIQADRIQADRVQSTDKKTALAVSTGKHF